MASFFKEIDPTQFKRYWLDVKFGPDPRQSMDIWLPDEGDGPFPLIVFVHGGGWVGGDKRENTMPGAFKVMSQGYAMAAINYRIAPDVVWPAPLEDVRAGIRYLRAHAAEYNLKTDKIAAWGNSAGAHILNMVAALGGRPIMKGKELGNPEVDDSLQCLVSLYGPSDMYQVDLCNRLTEDDVVNATGGTEVRNDQGEGMVFPHNLIMGFKCSRNAAAASFGSPVNFVTPDFPPAYLMHGISDPVVPYTQSVSFRNKINETCYDNNRCKLKLFEGATHGDPCMKTNEVVDDILDFIDAAIWEGPHERTPLPEEIAVRDADGSGDDFEN
jgi:acetyl esterase/lipase